MTTTGHTRTNQRRIIDANVFLMQPHTAGRKAAATVNIDPMGNDGGAEDPQSYSGPTVEAETIPEMSGNQMSNVGASPEPNNNSSGTQWSTQYVEDGESTRIGPQASSEETLDRAHSPEELLRVLSASEQPPNLDGTTQPKPRKGYPGLDLSYNVISATFCVPYKVDYSENDILVGINVTCIAR